MKKYIVNTTADSNGDHEVHENTCLKLPVYHNQKDLGYHFGCRSAVQKAKDTYPTANGCYHCSRVCHTS
ncbi:hypothetical protein [Salinimicrobium sediminilitoris]|uniref:hypothetical protein n=1 Tax=Salinimicrobium sediminilitoris TaxID=2876715 RepID=UPI001E5B4BF3|nr:hypothetical protein [Salinimicrobium sediminilitoris]MCC8360650.1 hypothetical protein [Salinimicrobium sediminilitoris]